MISDQGTELLLAAIYRQAREDLEAAYTRAVLARKACERGRVSPYRNAARGPSSAGDIEETALWWYSGRPWLPADLAEMVAVVADHRRYCLSCRTKEG